MATQIYAADNDGILVPNPMSPSTNGWVGGDMKNEVQAANTTLLRQSRLFAYLGQPALFRCPADRSVNSVGIPRVRSYAMNSWIGSRTMETTGTAGRTYRTFVKDAEFSATGAATLWLLADEHELTIDDGCFLVTMDDSQPLASFPTSWHQRSFPLNFMDGRAEAWPLRDANTKLAKQGSGQISRNNLDWLRLKQATTVLQ